MKVSSAKVLVVPPGDVPCVTPPPPKSYRIANIQRQITSKRGRNNANRCEKQDAPSQRELTAFVLLGAFAAHHTATRKWCGRPSHTPSVELGGYPGLPEIVADPPPPSDQTIVLWGKANFIKGV